MKIALLPCPFCGGKADCVPRKSELVFARVACTKCEASGPYFEEYEVSNAFAKAANKERAIQHWNTRA